MMRAWIQHSIEDSAEGGDHKFIMIPINREFFSAAPDSSWGRVEQVSGLIYLQIVSKSKAKNKDKWVEYAGDSVGQIVE